MTTTLDDTSPFFSYYGNWLTQDGPNAMDPNTLPLYHNQTYHTVTAVDAYVILRWKGTGVTLYGAARSNKGNFSVSVDGGSVIVINGYSATNVVPWEMYQVANLPDTIHQVQLTNAPSWQYNTPGTAFGLDYAVVVGTPLTPGQFNSLASSSSSSTVSSTASSSISSSASASVSSSPPSSSSSSQMSSTTSSNVPSLTAITDIGTSPPLSSWTAEGSQTPSSMLSSASGKGTTVLGNGNATSGPSLNPADLPASLGAFTAGASVTSQPLTVLLNALVLLVVIMCGMR
ncbi:hypothetical protein TREMEDRAFT_65498 [Tremella mesenterica DSM 1558]|uniref:uncharacterized protein n=1 Tax=Tremella mesenterica (strain ATCC 24925 / CBS 8224 / DSM 1558 / NBRC 9311 / NRRL Y-6157 / RJB 2259-6 / UBC 559-6) TaxID=578456 RepID=UPI00032BD4D7|nr:uncharacterized protein TREMEDRAFT_65498 [Tremella mesenterica DSM 1558]EIW66630.1 hypothetical protein TREMEDRAFT_65498 [Tremella mesenterica DSM 1558]